MTFAKTPPSVPGFYVCRVNEYDDTPFPVLLHQKAGFLVSELTCETPQEMECEWCRLVPAEEVEKAWLEGLYIGMSRPTETRLEWARSHAKQVVEGKI